jgi:hypothetical protein
MQTDPLLVNELRSAFKAGATPSALVRRIAERYPGAGSIDVVVRAYFREAFCVPMLRIGPEQVAELVNGGGLPVLNGSVLHLMVANRSEWDQPGTGEDQRCWLAAVRATPAAELLRDFDPKSIPELARAWDQLDEQGKQFIRRAIANAQSLYEESRVAGALAERLQQQVLAGEAVGARE